MRCLIAINPYSKTYSLLEKAKRMTEEFECLGCEAETMNSIDLFPILKDSKPYIERAKDFDLCVYLDKDKYLARALETYMPVFNSARSTELCDDKTTTFLALSGSGIRTPKTIPAPLCYTEPEEKEKEIFLDRVEKELGYPLVCKEAYGSLGKQVYLVKDRAGLEAIYSRLCHTTHLYQEFVGESISSSRDYRVITVGGSAVASMVRVNPADFRSNIGCGGHAEKVETLPEEIRNIAELSSKLLGLEYAGVDIAVDKGGKPTLLEVNSNAFFKGVESVSGVNVAHLFAKRCLDLVKKR